MARTKAIASLFGIAVLSALLFCVRDSPADSPFQHAARHLRIGMTSDEVNALARVPRPGVGITVSMDHGSQWVIYSDHQRRETLSLVFVDDEFQWSRLAKWEVWHH